MAQHAYAPKRKVAYEREQFPFRITDVQRVNRFGYLVWAHWHEEVECIQVVDGPVLVTIDGQSFVAENNAIVFFNSGQIHAVQEMNGSRSRIKGIVFDTFFLTNVLEGFDTKHLFTLFTHTNATNNLFRPNHPLWSQLNNWMATAHDEYAAKQACYEMVVKACMYQIVAAIVRDYQRTFTSNNRLQTMEQALAQLRPVLRYIETHYAEPIYLDQMCNMVHMSASSFSRVFKRTMGMTLSQYTAWIRIQLAKKYLLEHQLSVTEIAERTGFYDIHYFGKVFKKATGVSPLQFRSEVNRFS